MFRSDLYVVAVPPNLWRLEQALVWDDGDYGHVAFPAGTVTDLGSTPQYLRRFRAFDPTGPSRRAAVGHDYLYSRGCWPSGEPVTRARADEFLRAALISEGVSRATAWLWYRGVRIGGWVAWRRYRPTRMTRVPLRTSMTDATPLESPGIRTSTVKNTSPGEYGLRGVKTVSFADGDAVLVHDHTPSEELNSAATANARLRLSPM